MIENKVEQELQWQREDAEAAFPRSSAPGRTRQEQGR
jgi:hypothetical protein